MSQAGSSNGSTTLYGTFTATETAFSLSGSIQSKYNAVSPLKVLRELINTLQTNDVAGPFLLRTVTEYTEGLGAGAFSEVRGANPDIVRRSREASRDNILYESRVIPEVIAVKQHRSRAGKAPASQNEAQDFLAKHFKDAMREIVALTHPNLREHPNIVRLLGWGLCLDSLEDDALDKVNIPLLVLERADGDLHNVLQHDARLPNPTITLDQRLKICVDIAKGLQALHDIPLSHGDLKTANILVFHRRDQLTAKLCDFGTANAMGALSELPIKYSRYRGTMGWRAPEVLKPQEKIDSVLCDVYAYGLVVWSVFANNGRACLDTTTEDSHEVLEAASTSLKSCLPSTTAYQKRCKKLISKVIEESLSYKPRRRSRDPWRHLGTSRSWATSNTKPSITTLAVSNLWQAAKERASAVKLRNAPQLSKMLLSPQQKMAAFAAFVEEIGLETTTLIEDSEASSIDPNGIDEIKHVGNDCVRFAWLQPRHQRVNGLLKLMAKSSDEKRTQQTREVLYCYARFRSRLLKCCWKSNVETEENVIRTYLQNTPLIDTSFAWLCRGEVGAMEVASLDVAQMETFLTAKRFDNSQRVECFLILLQAGFRIGVPTSGNATNRSLAGKPSVLHAFVNTFNEAAMGSVMQLICRRFDSLQQSQSIPQMTRDFMLGPHITRDFMLGSPKQRKRTEEMRIRDKWTALHEFADDLKYEAVENLIRIGANPDVKSRICEPPEENYLLTPTMAPFIIGDPLQICESKGVKNRSQALSQQRIVALLRSSRKSVDRQNAQGSTRAADAMRLPQGWSAHNIYESVEKRLRSNWPFTLLSGAGDVVRDEEILEAETRRRPIDVVYYETFTGSITWKKPTFSLLSGGRVALGYRKMQGYYLDLIAFLTPPPPSSVTKSIETRFPDLDDAWYRQEPFEVGNLHDALAELKEPWTSTFKFTVSTDAMQIIRSLNILLALAWIGVGLIGAVVFIDWGIRYRRHARFGLPDELWSST